RGDRRARRRPVLVARNEAADKRLGGLAQSSGQPSSRYAESQNIHSYRADTRACSTIAASPAGPASAAARSATASAPRTPAEKSSPTYASIQRWYRGSGEPAS